MAFQLTEQSVAEMAPNDKALVAGRGLIKKGALKKLAKSEDGTLVFGFCQGSGKLPYEVSVDLATGSDRPTTRCSCPSQQFPCKHAIGLMLAFVAGGRSFAVAQPPAALLEKRAKLAVRAEKKAATPEAPRKVDKAAAAKKTQEQSDALDTLETFLVDLVGAGLGGLTGKSIKAIDTQAKRMMDADLKRASQLLQRLSHEVSADDDDEDDEDEKQAARGLSAERQARIAALATQLWVTLRRGKKALTGKLDEGGTQAEADAQVESLLGRAWKLTELKEAGYWVTGRTLIELAHEQRDDAVIEMKTASGYLLDLGDGSIVEEQTTLPYAALKFAKLRGSRLGVLDVKEAALYPGEVVNRRLRWDDKQEGVVTERPRTAADYAALHARGLPLDAVLKLFRAQAKNPLNPGEAVALLSVKRFGLLGEALVAEDPAGARLVIRDPRGASSRTSLNLRHAAGAFGPGAAGAAGPWSLAVRLYLDPVDRAVQGQALALFAGDKHLRLGM